MAVLLWGEKSPNETKYDMGLGRQDLVVFHGYCKSDWAMAGSIAGEPCPSDSQLRLAVGHEQGLDDCGAASEPFKGGC